MRTRYDNVEKMKYNLEEPINIIFDAVEKPVEIDELDGRPYSAQQIVDLGYIILSKNRIFRSDIRKWVRKPEDEKTWTNFKTTFIEALRCIGMTNGVNWDKVVYVDGDRIMPINP